MRRRLLAVLALASPALAVTVHEGTGVTCVSYTRKEFPIRFPQKAHLVVCTTPCGEALGFELRPNGQARCTGHGTTINGCSDLDMCGAHIRVGCDD